MVVWPKVITTTSVSNGLMYAASASTMVAEGLAMPKNSSSFTAAFIISSVACTSSLASPLTCMYQETKRLPNGFEFSIAQIISLIKFIAGTRQDKAK